MEETCSENRGSVDLPPDVVARALRQIMRERGSVRSAKKAGSSAENGRLGGRPERPLSDLLCACSAGDALDGHKTYCPRGRAIKRRQGSGPK